MRKMIVTCLLLSSCMSNIAFDGVQSLSASKQKQRITFLQKKLEIAEKGLKGAQEEVEHLHSELHQSQLSLIARQIENYEQHIRQVGPSRLSEEKIAPFLKEREILQQMMENGPSPEAFEAQVVLDRILRMITESL